MRHNEHEFFQDLINYSGMYKKHFASMYNNIELYSEYLAAGKDLESCANKARNLLEAVVNYFYESNITLKTTRKFHRMTNNDKDMTLFEKINADEFKQEVGSDNVSKMNKIRMFGNRGAHDDISNSSTGTSEITIAEAEVIYKMLVELLYLVSETSQLAGKASGLKSNWIYPEVFNAVNKMKIKLVYPQTHSLNPDFDFGYYSHLRPKQIKIPERVNNVYKGNAYLLHEVGHSKLTWFERKFTSIKKQEAKAWVNGRAIAKKIGMPDKGDGLTWDSIEADALKTYKDIKLTAKDWSDLFKKILKSCIRFTLFFWINLTILLLGIMVLEPGTTIGEDIVFVFNLIKQFFLNLPESTSMLTDFLSSQVQDSNFTVLESYLGVAFYGVIFALIRRIPTIITFFKSATDHTMYKITH